MLASNASGAAQLAPAGAGGNQTVDDDEPMMIMLVQYVSLASIAMVVFLLVLTCFRALVCCKHCKFGEIFGVVPLAMGIAKVICAPCGICQGGDGGEEVDMTHQIEDESKSAASFLQVIESKRALQRVMAHGLSPLPVEVLMTSPLRLAAPL